MNLLANAVPSTRIVRPAQERVGQYDWTTLSGDLSHYGCAVLEKLLAQEECRQIAALYSREQYFRSHIHMARHGFGRGEYRYFKYPLPELLAGLRTALYSRLASRPNRGPGWAHGRASLTRGR